MPPVRPRIKPRAVLEDYAQILKTAFKATDNFCPRTMTKTKLPYLKGCGSFFCLFVSCFSAVFFLILRQ